MGFRAAKAKILKCLERGDVSHEQRGDIDIKNLLAIGEVSLDDVPKSSLMPEVNRIHRVRTTWSLALMSM